MARVWSEERKLELWLDVELAALGPPPGSHAGQGALGRERGGWACEPARARSRVGRALGGVGVGKRSGVAGRYGAPHPGLEGIACDRLGLARGPVSTQILRRDRH